MRSGNKQQAALSSYGQAGPLTRAEWGRAWGRPGRSARPLGGAVHRDLPQRPALAPAPQPWWLVVASRSTFIAPPRVCPRVVQVQAL